MSSQAQQQTTSQYKKSDFASDYTEALQELDAKEAMKLQQQIKRDIRDAKRIQATYPLLIRVKEQKLDHWNKLMNIKAEKLDEVIKAISNSFTIIQDTVRLAVVNPLLIAFWAASLLDLLILEATLLANLLAIETFYINEIGKGIEDYYVLLPDASPL